MNRLRAEISPTDKATQQAATLPPPLRSERAKPDGTTDGRRPALPVVRGWFREILGLLHVLNNRRLLASPTA